MPLAEILALLGSNLLTETLIYGVLFMVVGFFPMMMSFTFAGFLAVVSFFYIHHLSYCCVDVEARTSES